MTCVICSHHSDPIKFTGAKRTMPLSSKPFISLDSLKGPHSITKGESTQVKCWLRWKPSKNSHAINQDLKTITSKTHKKPPVIHSNLTSRFNFCRIYKICWLEIAVFWFCFIYFGVENQSSAFFAEDSQKKSETCKMETQTQAWTSWWILTFLLNHMLAIKPTSGNTKSVPVRNQRQINCYTGTDQWFMSCNIKLLTILIATYFRERSLKWQDHSLQWFEVLFFLDYTCWN